MENFEFKEDKKLEELFLSLRAQENTLAQQLSKSTLLLPTKIYPKILSLVKHINKIKMPCT